VKPALTTGAAFLGERGAATAIMFFLALATTARRRHYARVKYRMACVNSDLPSEEREFAARPSPKF
jgi:hypothetical protein